MKNNKKTKKKFDSLETFAAYAMLVAIALTIGGIAGYILSNICS